MTVENVILFEDDVTEPFFPLIYTRSVFELKVGLFSSLERAFLLFPGAKFNLFAREYLKPVLSLRYPKYFINNTNIGLRALIINGRAILHRELVDLISAEESKNLMVTSQGNWVLASLSGELLLDFIKLARQVKFNHQELTQFLRKKTDVSIQHCQTSFIESPWEMIASNGKRLTQDFHLMGRGGIILSKVSAHVAMTCEDQIYVGKDVQIDPFVHIDASSGPVYIGDHVRIKSHVTIEGPACIDDHCLILPGYIRKNTTLGEGCRVGGEISESIFLAHSNKQHAGFVGNSYVGEWVNFGALTTTSNLKNNYGEIRLTRGHKSIPTGKQFLGSIIGDHVKLGIGTLLSTGTIIGLGSSIALGNRFLPKWIPSFSWMTSHGLSGYDLEKFLSMIVTTYKRRDKVFGLPERSLMEYVFSLAKNETGNNPIS